MNFNELKQEVLHRAKKANACTNGYKRALESETPEELAEVIKNNLSFVREHNILPTTLLSEFDRKELFDSGKENTGLFNSGNYNSGDGNNGNYNSGDGNNGNYNSGDGNNGDRNIGRCNSGHYNIGNYNSGDRNSGDFNSGHYNSGYRNSGYRNSGYHNSGYHNSGYRNSGYRNSGYRNSGDYNSGYRNSGDYNSGYRNVGIFCNRKEKDKVIIFNRESDMTWSEWYKSKAYSILAKLKITEWVAFGDMNDKEKKLHPKAHINGGYLKVYEYKEAWANLWKTLTEKEKEAIKSIPNFDSEVFEDITGIKVEL